MKPYFHKKELVVPLYEAQVVIILSNDNEKIKKHFDEFEDKELYAITWVNEDRDDDKFYIGLNFNYSEKKIFWGTVNHEIFHLTNYVLDSRGILPEHLNDEPAAYLLDYLSNQVYNFIRDCKFTVEYSD